MKNVILLSILLFTGSAFAAPSAKTVAAYDANKRAQLIEWIEQLRGLAGEADKKAEAAQVALTASQAKLTAANTNLAVLRSDIENLTKWGNEQRNLYLAADAKLQSTLIKYHRIKLWTGLALACGAGLLVGILIWRFAAPALNTVPGAILAFGVPTAAAGIVFTLVQTLL